MRQRYWLCWLETMKLPSRLSRMTSLGQGPYVTPKVVLVPMETEVRRSEPLPEK